MRRADQIHHKDIFQCCLKQTKVKRIARKIRLFVRIQGVQPRKEQRLKRTRIHPRQEFLHVAFIRIEWVIQVQVHLFFL
jgi:hypothetical protein